MKQSVLRLILPFALSLAIVQSGSLGRAAETPKAQANSPAAKSDPSVRQKFVHPGGWHTETELERVRKNVAAGKQPWLDAWKAIQNADVNTNYQPHVAASVTDAYWIQNDGHAAYALAIKWVASGDIAYAKASERIIDAWVSTVESAAPTTMRNGIGANQMANAAEILAYGFNGTAGWPATNVARAKSWFRNVVYPRVKNGASANWGTSCMAGIMSMAVFCDDREMFGTAVDAYKHGFVVKGSLKDGCCGVTQYIDATGEDAESGRDQGHSQGGIAHLLEVAMVAWNQGVNLVTYNDDYGVRDYGVSGANRLFVGFEYTAKYNLGNDVPYHPFFEYCNDVTIYPDGVSAKGRGNFSPIWEMAVHLFNAIGLKPIYCQQVVEKQGYMPEPGNSDHPGFGTLMFRKQPKSGVVSVEAQQTNQGAFSVWSGDGSTNAATLLASANSNMVISLTIHADQVVGQIDQRIYGQFLEHIYHSCNGGIWGDVVWNRSFEELPPRPRGMTNSPPTPGPVLPRHWLTVGNGVFAIDTNAPFNSQRCVKITTTAAGVGIAQNNFCLRKGDTLRGSLWLRGQASGGMVVRLLDGDQVLAEQKVSTPKSEWREFKLALKPKADVRTATLQILTRGKAEVWIDQVSLMPDSYRANGGFRTDLLKAVADLKPATIRWPGGAFVGEFNWKTAIGPQSKRVGKRGWDEFDPMSFGVDEFMALCKKVGAEPVLAFPIGPHRADVDRTKNLQDALDWLEYCNGPATSKWGKVRAANGHPEPYHVKYWEVDNEVWINKMPVPAYLEAVKLFSTALRAKDPTIEIIACGGRGTRNTGDDSYNLKMFEGDVALWKYFSIHHYENPNSFAGGVGNMERHFGSLRELIAKSANPGMKLYLSEWNAQTTDWRTGLYAGGLLNAMERNSDIVAMACPALFLRHVTAPSWDNAFINFDNGGWFPAPNYVVMKLFREHFATNRLAMTGETGALNVVATRSDDGQHVFVKIVNPSEHAVPLTLNVGGAFAPDKATLQIIAPDELLAKNSLGSPAAIHVAQGHTSIESNQVRILIPRWCVGVLDIGSSDGFKKRVEKSDYPVSATLPASGVRKITGGPFKADWNSFKQYQCPDWFRDAKFGIWAHWGAQCEPEQGDWYARRMYDEGSAINRYHVAHYGHPSQFGFKDVIHEWHAENWKPDKLMTLYKRAGAKFFVGMAVHHDNFDLYDSKYQPWNSLNVGPKKDIIGLWKKAARKQGLKFGVSDHAAATIGWWASSLGADTNGPFAGVPYDGHLTKVDGIGQWWEGLDPRDLYPPLRQSDGKVSEADRQQFIQRWFVRAQDLVDKYDPDYFYHDWSKPPYGDVGLDLMAHFYNSSVARRGKMDVVMTAKNLTPEQCAGMVNDVERGGRSEIEPYPWETDTCIGDWHYDRTIFEQHRYKTSAQILQMLADVVSKNGTLLLSIPIKGDGTIDSDETAFLAEMGRWMDVNDEAIFGTRPWKIFGEGPNNVEAGDMGERNVRFTSEDIRFTTKGGVLYAIALGWPESGKLTIKSLKSGSEFYPAEIGKVTLLGSRAKIQSHRDAGGLIIDLPGRKPIGPTYVFKITPANSKP